MSGLTRSFAPGHFLLELEGAPVGYLRNVQGGGATAEVIAEKVGADHIVHKHIGGVRFDDIVLTCDAGLSKNFYDWVSQTTAWPSIRRNGAVIVMDSGKEISRLEWKNGLITWIEFPAFDAASKDAVALTIKISPEITRSAQGGGRRPTAPARQSWLASSFRLRIAGLEDACQHVSRIEPLAISRRVKAQSVGAYRDVALEPSSDASETGNLVVTLPESRAKGFFDWFDDFVLKENSGQSKEKRGTLESGIFTLEFGNLGIAGITRPSSPSGSMVRRTTVEMYSESIRLRATVG